jgi:hypothetical protein
MKLITKHLFPFIRMINKLNIKEDLKEFYLNKIDVSGKTDKEIARIEDERGMDFVFLILEKLPQAENEVYDFLALYSGKTVEELQEAELEETISLLTTLFQDKLFTAFFQQAVK